MIIQEAPTLVARLLHHAKAYPLLDKACRLANSKLKEVIKEAERHFALEEGSVNRETVCSRVKRFNVDGKNYGNILPIEELGEYVKFYAIPLARIGSPLERDKIIQLANNIIHANPDQHDRIISWKTKYVQRSKKLVMEAKMGNS